MSDRLLPFDAALERLKALHPKSIDLSLDRMRRLCDALGNPERKLPPVVHVAGTNGKGSTVAFVRAIAEAAGLSVHTYTSPHLVRFAERVRLNGTLISDEHLAEVLDRVEAANAGEPITFFEVTTAAGLLAFAEAPADLLVLEVGLGGVLDATNVIDPPAVAVIAPVDLDHREFLGSTIEAVAGEKAGILKTGAPAVIGRQNPNAMAVLEARAARLGVRMSAMGTDFDAFAERGGMVFQGEDRLHDLPAPTLPGPHQIDNAGLAIAACLALNDARIDDAAIAEGVRSASWPGRLQRLTRGPLGARAQAAGAELILDGGHNPHAARALATALSDMDGRDRRPLVLIAGMLQTKDALAFFEALRRLKPEVLTVPFESDAAVPPKALAQSARMIGLKAEAAVGLEAALDAALAKHERPRVVICGSLYLVGEALALSQETWPS
ncbi:MAG: bifunctional folylpolyglutamate synthase/dihydrofolate synthase [Proteobacteria bacterium]|nr:bifunctional folylpolyglutamate synthase/dihydrofolate synthase [Pseudomonadota bacterium]